MRLTLIPTFILNWLVWRTYGAQRIEITDELLARGK
jgi:hypothetical protein